MTEKQTRNIFNKRKCHWVPAGPVQVTLKIKQGLLSIINSWVEVRPIWVIGICYHFLVFTCKWCVISKGKVRFHTKHGNTDLRYLSLSLSLPIRTLLPTYSIHWILIGLLCYCYVLLSAWYDFALLLLLLLNQPSKSQIIFALLLAEWIFLSSLLKAQEARPTWFALLSCCYLLILIVRRWAIIS